MKIAVMISTYNGEEYIRDQIESILNQKVDAEVIDIYIRDDGSNDNTLIVLEECGNKGNIFVYPEKNIGVVNSFMTLIKTVPRKYDFYFFCDQDDYWIEDKLSKELELFTEEEIPQLCFSNAQIVDSELKSIGEANYVYKGFPELDFYTSVVGGYALGCTMGFNSSLFEKLTDISQDDFDSVVMHDLLAFNVCTLIGGKLYYTNEATVLYRQHSNNVIGVNYNFLGKIKGLFNQILYAEKRSISGQAVVLKKYYCEDGKCEYVKWLDKVAVYKKSFYTRLSLALSRKYKYFSKMTGLKIRLSIFLGNR